MSALPAGPRLLLESTRGEPSLALSSSFSLIIPPLSLSSFLTLQPYPLNHHSPAMKFSAPLALLALSLPMAFASPVARNEEVKKCGLSLPLCTVCPYR